MGMTPIMKKIGLMMTVAMLAACGEATTGGKGAKYTTPSLGQNTGSQNNTLRKIYFYSPDVPHNGAFGGASGADAFCKSERPTELDNDNFEAHAMLNFSGLQTIASMASLQAMPVAPVYAYGSNVKLADDWSDLLTNGLHVSLADAGIFAPNTIYWTGFNEDGTTAQSYCNGFNNGTASYSGQIGNSSYTDGRWAGFQEDSCAALYQVLCVAFTQ